ncbi:MULTISPECIES: glutamyl-tRNA reductase [unclassified Actinomyces]|uniref:glutamyl-tRNA reductase n=1 Tax=unclassified Actinomyces TaxID=2609248 RepID=UPI0013A6D8E8|nr:glutamyl-tRNA reductase [Actinomyces sp. 594]MBW3068127.1 glutamyl-tRNA reductase [Actinomyces sp. 594]NDR53002.1 glutamyl-tRNA reductase [Actinomyces sp. 565]
MTIHLLSADHRTQGLDAVARLGATAAHLGPDLMRALPQLRGAIVLGTCNRLALLLDAPQALPADALRHDVTGFLARRAGLRPAAEALAGTHPGAGRHWADAGPVAAEPVELTAWSGNAAVNELFATAAGLESMVVGEREIAGQLRRAMRVATEEDTLSTDLSRAVEHASTASRRVAHETGLAGNGRSVVGVGVDLAARHLPPLEGVRTLIVGTGAYAGATVTALRRRGVIDISVYSRSDRAAAFAVGRGLRAIDDVALPDALAGADLVITCRGLGAPVLTRELVAPAAAERAAGPARPHAGTHLRPLVILDLALTRDVERAVGSMPGVRLIDLPSVQRSVPAAEARQVQAARAIVDEETALFERMLSGRRMDPVVCSLRGHVAELVEEEVARLRVRDGQVDAGDAARALHHLAARMLHHPTVAARAAAEAGRGQDYLDALDLLLGVEIAADLRAAVAPATTTPAPGGAQ